MTNRIPPIREFPKDDRHWRIDWLGAVERTSSEALIEVFLSPVKSGILWPREQKHFDNDTVRVQIGVGQLPFLAIGSIWRNGAKQEQSAGYPASLSSIRIGSDTVRLVDASTKLATDRWMIPPFEHRLLKSTWSSKCLVIEHEGDPFGILVPVTEAIRFYYAVSTDLAHVIFNGALQLHRNSVIDTALSGMLSDRDRMVLKLRQWLADDDGWIIGRALADAVAGAGMARVYDSLVRSSANARSAFPECGLPFEGYTRWDIRGIPLKPEGHTGSRWLVFEIRQCAAPFPFDELEVIRDNDGRRGNPETDLPEEEKRPAWAGPLRKPEPAPDGELKSGEPPDAAQQRLQIPYARERFEALFGKSVIKTLKDRCRYKSSSFREDMLVDSLATGDGVAGQEDVGPAKVEWRREAEIQRRKALPASFEVMLAVVEALNAMPGVCANVRPSAPEIAHLPLSKPSRMQQWSYLDFKSKLWRQVMAVDIAYGERHASLIEFEARPSEQFAAGLLVSHSSEPISNAALARLFRLLVSGRGVWSSVPAQSGIQLIRLKHTRPSATEFATAVVQAGFGVR